MARSQTKVLNDPLPEIGQGPLNPFEIVQNNEPNAAGDVITFDDGVMNIQHEDGSVTIDFDPKPVGAEDEDGFYANLAKKISESELSLIGSDLIEGINRDEESRAEWLETRAKGISLLGVKLKTPKSDVGSSGAGMEGMSSIDHPVILEATINFQATARAELLPANGPVKVRNDTPNYPQTPLEPTNVQEKLKDSLTHLDEVSQALERDMNHYLTVTATEYVPDTDRMLFYVGFGGDGFKKVYNCPLRRRPVSESVDAEDLIVSNGATDLKNCGRVTHRIKMRKSVLKRMQILGVYRDVEISDPGYVTTQTEVDRKKEEISGIKDNIKRPQDRDYELYETYCELDLDEFAPEEFRGKGLPLPYRVTIEKHSRQILDIRRNWNEDDPQCMPKQFFVQFPFIRGLGFYGLGYIHILGNIAMTLTAAWRETIDAGMYASFPGFLYSKQIGRQLTNQFRVPPGGGIGVDLGAQQRIQDAIMPIPYKEVGGSFTNFIQYVEQVGRKLATTGSVAVGEGKQEAPVGTTLALIEQATKVLDSSHKRLHAAQAEEFALLKDRFREDPEAFWRFNRHPAHKWEKEQFLEALNNCNIVPVADPNNPTSLHRAAKAIAIKELQKGSPELYDPVAVDMRVMQIMGIDAQGLFRPKAAPPPPDPRFEAIKAKAQASKEQVQIQLADSQMRAKTEQIKIADKERDRLSRERVQAMRIELEKLKMYQQSVIHDKEAYADSKAKELELYKEFLRETGLMEAEKAKHVFDAQTDYVKHRDKLQHERELNAERLAHEREMKRSKSSTETEE